MNEDLRKILNGNIKKAIADAKLASSLAHPGLIGGLREIFINDLFLPLLNTKYSCGSGKISDFEGNLSKEVDLCVYSTSLHPPFLFSRNSRTAIYPIESILGCYEIKSRLNIEETRDAFEKFNVIHNNLKFSPGKHDENNLPLPHIFSKPECSLFSYDIERKNYSPKSILEIYKKVDPKWNINPRIEHICVAGKGCLTFSKKGWLHMSYDSQTDMHEEVIHFLCATIQRFPITEASRHTPRIGYYLSDPAQTVRFVNGRPLEKSWNNTRWIITNTDLENRDHAS